MEKRDTGTSVCFVISTLSVGLSSAIWKVFADEAEGGDGPIFIFPHSFSPGDEFTLPLRCHADGYICWSSNISAFRSDDPLSGFLSKLGDIPYVTIGVKVPGHPAVSFDSYGSITSLLEHLRTVHGAERIAFLRGPEWHSGAEERFRAYRDWLDRNGIGFDPDLVSSPREWEDGREAMEEILCRGLVPGRDFRAAAGASDRIILHAADLLIEKGYSIPDDVLVTGFNDGRESLQLPVPATTARIPSEEMGIEALRLLYSEIHGSHSDCLVRLPSHPVIRASCGCYDSMGGEQRAAERITDMETYISWLEDELSIPLPRRHGIEAFVRESAVSSDLSGIAARFSDYAFSYFLRGGELRLIYEAVRWFYLFIRRDEAFIRMAEDALLRRVPAIQERAYRQRVFIMRRTDEQFSLFQEAVISSESWTDLGAALVGHLPQFDMDAAWCAVGTGSRTFLAAGFDGDKLLGRMFFPSSDLIPDMDRLGSGIYITGSSDEAYAVIRTCSSDGALIERVLSTLLTAMKRLAAHDSPDLFSDSMKIITLDCSEELPGFIPPGMAAVPFSGRMLPAGMMAESVRMFFISGKDGVQRARQIREDHRFSGVPVVLSVHGTSAYALQMTDDLPDVMVLEDFIIMSSEVSGRLSRLASGEQPLLDRQIGRPVRMAMEYIAVNYASDITRWKMAESLNISEDYLERLFRKETGLTLWEYLLRFRIGVAEDLISGIHLSVAAAAERTGFSNRSYFCRVFRRLRGYPPKDAKRRSSAKDDSQSS